MQFPIEAEAEPLVGPLRDIGFWSYRFDEERAIWSESQWRISAAHATCRPSSTRNS